MENCNSHYTWVSIVAIGTLLLYKVSEMLMDMTMIRYITWHRSLNLWDNIENILQFNYYSYLHKTDWYFIR